MLGGGGGGGGGEVGSVLGEFELIEGEASPAPPSLDETLIGSLSHVLCIIARSIFLPCMILHANILSFAFHPRA